jgi:NAD(P)-dependent dehydrogenase (short-subunit alcohol dehydrogenase family)
MTAGGNQEFHVPRMLCNDFHKMTPLIQMQPAAKGDRLVGMRIQDKVVVVTGGAHGIGRALCLRFAREGARAVVVADLDGAAATGVAAELRASGTDALALETDVSNEPRVRGLVASACNAFGRIDLYCSNAGISILGGEETPDAEWDRIFAVNVRSHIYAARAVLPHMLERGEGYLLQTISAAGLLTMPGSAPYSVTKHAALAFAEWLAITYGRRGIKVSALCPQGVRTAMLRDAETLGFQFLLDTAITPEQVAEEVVRGLDREKFLILPHPEVADYFRRKATDYDRWIAGMQKLH